MNIKLSQKTLFNFLFFCIVSLLIVCSDQLAGSGTDVGNPDKEEKPLAGTFVDSAGTPVQGAIVTIRLRGALADTSGNSTTKIYVDTTDADGCFGIDSIVPGSYSIEAVAKNTMALIESVAVIHPDSQLNIGTDTLMLPGIISGTLKLPENGNPRKTFIIAYGLDRFIIPDTSGFFEFTNLAEGLYRLLIISSLDDYGEIDTAGIPVLSDQTTDLDTLVLPYLGIPTPKGLTISYDTLKQLVTLTWNIPSAGRSVQGYNIYRKHSDSANFAKIAGIITDTVFVDSTAAQDQAYSYKVDAVDTNDMEGTRCEEESVTIICAYQIVDTVCNVGAEFYSMGLLGGDTIITITLDGTVRSFDTLGNVINTWSIGSPLEGTYIYNALEILNHDTIIIVDGTNTVNFYGFNGNFHASFSPGFQIRGVAVIDTSIYLADTDSKRIVAYSFSGIQQFQWSNRGGGTSQFGTISGIESSISDLRVMDSKNGLYSVITYDKSGTFVHDRNFNQNNYISMRIAEFAGNTYVASRQYGHIFTSDNDIFATFLVSATQSGILALSGSEFWVAMKAGYFLRYRKQ